MVLRGAGERLGERPSMGRARAGGADGSRGQERLRPPDGAGEWCLLMGKLSSRRMI